MTGLIDRKVLLELQQSIGPESLPLVLNTFIQQGEQELRNLNNSLTSSQLKELCHSLKSSAASVGAMHLANTASQIEYRLGQLTHADLQREARQLSSLLRESLIALSTCLLCEN